MADGKVTISTALDNSGISKGVRELKGTLGGLTKVAAGVTASITAAFGAAAVAITKQSVDAYADYEQLIGGVETLFKDGADKVAAYAEDAFYRAGVSANKYMETVTSFSASLISSLGGDTAKAADVADMAMVDMADNANKMGTAVESIQNAYQGFAKQNYTMLDNLKLGYGGTKTEMERLLKDAEAYSGVKYDIDNLADVYSAIHAIQEKLDIAGATAKEAEKTISGSAAMTKAAWQNVLAAISGGGDLDKAINNLVFSVSKYFENIVPVVERALAGIGQMIEQIAPALVQSIATALIKAIPSLLNAVYQMVVGLAKGIYQGVVALVTGAESEVTAQIGGSASDALGEVADGYDAAAEATEEAQKASERYLAGFDEIQKAGGGDDAGNGPTVTSPGSSAGEPLSIDVDGSSVGATIGTLETLKEKLEEVATWTGLDKLWANLRKGIEKIDFGAIKTNFEEIFDGLAPIAQATFDGIGSVSTSFSSLVGTTLGGIASVTGKQIEIATGGIAEFLESEGGTISQWITDTADTISTGFDDLSFSTETIFGTLWQALDDNHGQIEASISNMLMSFSTMGMSVGTIFSDTWASINKGTAKWVDENQPLIEDFFDGVIEHATTFSNTLSEITEETFGTLLEWWNTSGKEVWDGIVECIGDIMTWVTELWNNCLQPVIQQLIEAVQGLWTNTLQPLWEKILGLISSLWGVIQPLWDGLLKPLVDWIIGAFGPSIGQVLTEVVNFFADAFAAIGSVLGGVIGAFGGLLDFISGVFTGDWEKAWQGICDFFGGIWDAIWGIIKGVINIIIDALNALWSGLYAAVRAVINGVGSIAESIGDLIGQDWGWEMPADPPKIPRLAQGAVLPANKPFLAMVGDQKHGTNVEAPLETIQEAVALVMADMLPAIMAGFEAVVEEQRATRTAVEGIEIGDTTIGRAAARYNTKMAIIRGGV